MVVFLWFFRTWITFGPLKVVRRVTLLSLALSESHDGILLFETDSGCGLGKKSQVLYTYNNVQFLQNSGGYEIGDLHGGHTTTS